MKTKQTGFTLVEIAIVLVIIGLLLGGILKGQEMITQAKIKNVVNDFNGITAAVNSYQDRYRALPGDDLNARSPLGRGASPATATAYLAMPASDHLTCTTTPLTAAPTAPRNELVLVAFAAGRFRRRHDRSAGSPGQQPANAANGIMGVQTSGMGFTSNIVCSSNLPDKIAIAVDTQMDDGTATTGQVRGTLQTAPNPAPAVELTHRRRLRGNRHQPVSALQEPVELRSLPEKAR